MLVHRVLYNAVWSRSRSLDQRAGKFGFLVKDSTISIVSMQWDCR